MLNYSHVDLSKENNGRYLFAGVLKQLSCVKCVTIQVETHVHFVTYGEKERELFSFFINIVTRVLCS